MTNKRYRYKNRVDEAQRAKNRNKSRVRSKLEHVFAVNKLRFGYVKVRYRGNQNLRKGRAAGHFFRKLLLHRDIALRDMKFWRDTRNWQNLT
jgi:IS5 family transposase